MTITTPEYYLKSKEWDSGLFTYPNGKTASSDIDHNYERNWKNVLTESKVLHMNTGNVLWSYGSFQSYRSLQQYLPRFTVGLVAHYPTINPTVDETVYYLTIDEMIENKIFDGYGKTRTLNVGQMHELTRGGLNQLAQEYTAGARASMRID